MTLLRSWLTLGACLFCPGGVGYSAQEVLPRKLEYNKHIRPILADRCFRCHGADGQARAAKLRLDEFDQAVLARAIVPGDVEHSKLVERISTTDQEEVMPPPDSHLPLSPDEKALLKHWVEEGAAYQKHWAFIPPVMPAVPRVEHARPQYDAWIAANGVPGELSPGAWNHVKSCFGGGAMNPWKPQAGGRFLFDDAKPKGGKDVANKANKKKPGGIKPGIPHGEPDEIGYHVAKSPVHVHDFHATMLHLLGINHERFTCHFQGRDFRLTDVSGKVVNEILSKGASHGA